ncbi:DEAD/DEAH box helicase [Neobacillus drentensis]|uniref:DEAD/DEAH box helicase n=1 Tax=Neobacillus drentensis TaxID=220684 RepID=UPI003000F982
MPRLFNFLRKEKSKDLIQQIYVDVKRNKDGIKYSLYRGQKDNHVSLPLKLSIYELRQQENISLLEILEELWLDEVLKDTDRDYLLPYSLFAEIPSEVKGILGILEPTLLQLKLGHEGAVGLSTFKLFLEKRHGKWQHLEKTSHQIGPWITLPDGNELLMDENQYDYQKLLEQAPNARDKEQIFSYVAEVRNKASKLNIPIDDYLKKQEYLFVDNFEIDVTYDSKEIRLEPRYSSSDDIPDDLLHEMSVGTSIFAAGPNNKKIFVNPNVQKISKQISNLDSIKGSNIPRFVENPETFLPDIEGLDISVFSDRVKSLGIQVYRAQPFVHANEKERGWFDIDTGFTVIDEEGEIHALFESEEILELVQRAKEHGDDFIEWNNQWIKVPQDAEVFIESSNKLRDEISKEVDITKLPYVLEIFENISHLEFNQPILEAQKQMKDLGILDPVPPMSFLANLKPFQEDGFIWLKSLHYRRIGGLLADDMGLGKTIQVVSFLSYLQQTNQLTPVLIVVPKTLIENWEKEIMKFAPSLLGSIRIHSGVHRSKNNSVLQQTGITITTYQTLVKDQLLFGQVDWQAVICDEAQAIKNPSTAASKVIKAMKARFRLAMTGTPVENSLSELWSILDFVQPGLLGSLSQFKKEFVTQMENTNSTEIEVQLTSRIARVYKRRTKTGELGNQLPPKNIVVREVPMGSVQLELYKEVLTLVKEKMLSGLEAIQKLKSLSSHPALINEKYGDLNAREVPKLTETLKIIEEVSAKREKVLIFTEYIQMQQLLRKWIRDRFEINPMIINGMTNRRQQLVDIFNEKSGFDVMILSPKAAGTGLTITAANHVIHYTRWWNPAVENQATDRVYRIGQEKPVTVYYPIVTDQQGLLREGTVEQIVHRILGEKLELATSVIVPSKKINIEDEVLKGLQVH